MDIEKIDNILTQKLNSMEKDLKQAMELLYDICAQKYLIEYLLQLKDEKKS